MDTLSAASESVHSMSHDQIFAILEDYNETCKLARDEALKESFINQSDLFFEFLENLIETFPQIFFEKSQFFSSSPHLSEHAPFKLIESHQFLIYESLKKRTVKTILKMIDMFKIMSKPSYELVIDNLMAIYPVIVECYQKGVTNFHIFLFPSFYFNDRQAIQNTLEILINIVTKIAAKDRCFLIESVHIVWSMMSLSFELILSVKSSLKLLYKCITTAIYPCDSIVVNVTNSLFSLILTSHLNLLENFFKKLSKITKVHEFFIISIIDYFCNRDESFTRLSLLEFHLIELLENSDLKNIDALLLAKVARFVIRSNHVNFALNIFKHLKQPQNPELYSETIVWLILSNTADKQKIKSIIDSISQVKNESELISIINFLYKYNSKFENVFDEDEKRILVNSVKVLVNKNFDIFDKVSLLSCMSLCGIQPNFSNFLTNFIELFPYFTDFNPVFSFLTNLISENCIIFLEKSLQTDSLKNDPKFIVFLSRIFEKYLDNLLMQQFFISIPEEILFQILFYSKPCNLPPLILNKVLSFSIVEANDDIFDSFCKFLFSLTFSTTYKQNVDEFLLDFISVNISNFKTFSHQNRFVIALCRIVENYECDAALFGKFFQKIVECALLFSSVIIIIFKKCLKTIFNKKGIKLMELYHSDPAIFHTPVLSRLSTFEIDQFLNYLFNAGIIFDSNDSSLLFSYLLTEIIKYSVLNCKKENLYAIAKLRKLEVRDLIVNNSKYIFPHLFVHASIDQIDKCIKFIESLIDFDIALLFRTDLHVIIHHSLLYLYLNEDKVLSRVCSLLNSTPFSTNIYSQTSLESFFTSKLLGILAFFNFSLVFGDLSYKKSVFKSLGLLLSYAGRKSIDFFRLKILSVLNFATELSIKHNCTEYTVKAWLSFVNNISNTKLAPLIAQIVPNVLSLSPYQENDVNKILQVILVEESRITHQFFHDIHLFYFKPAFQPISRILVDFWEKYNVNTNFNVILSNFLKHISSDQVSLRRAAIINFSEFIVSKYLSSDFSIIESAKPHIQTIYGKLLQCCSDPKSDLLFEAGRCLGILGCLDFNTLSSTNQLENKLVVPIAEKFSGSLDDFGVNLLVELSNTFLTANETVHQDRAAFAIQEVMQAYQFSNNRDRYLERFPESIREVLVPHLTSSYSIKPSSTKFDYNKPIFMSKEAEDYTSWIKSWCSGLISLLPSDSFRGSLLKPCFPICKFSHVMAKFLLPYVVIALGDSLTYNCINSEISYVLDLINKSPTSEHTIKAVQTIFELIDYVTDYVNSSKTRSPGIYVSYFRNLSKQPLSFAAFSCGMFSRSLRYLEQYVKEQPNENQVFLQHLGFLKKIYFNLNDYDAFVGVNRKSLTNQTDSTFVLQMESEGRFIEAIACHEKNKTQSPEQCSNQLSIMQCYLNLGQYESVKSQFKARDSSHSKQESNLYCEALWRLNDWSELDMYTSENKEVKCPIAESLLYRQHADKDNYRSNLVEAYRTEAKDLLVVGSQLKLMKSSNSLARLHALFDLEMYAQTSQGYSNICPPLDGMSSVNLELQIRQKQWERFSTNNLFDLIKNRLKSTEFEFNVREPIMSMHRVMTEFADQCDKFTSWVDIARLARKCGYNQTAFNYLLYASDSMGFDRDYLYEMAKHLIVNRSKHESLSFLRKHLDNITLVKKDDPDMGILTKLQLLMCRLMSETSDCDPSQIIKSFNDLLRMNQHVEKVHVSVGNYLHKLYQMKGDPTTKNICPVANIELNIIQHYGTSLKYGYRYLYHSLPKLITLWLDYPDVLTRKNSGEKINQTEAKQKIQKVCDKVKYFCALLQPFVFLSVLSQLVSRICHPNEMVWCVLSELLCKLLLSYPHQVSWQMIGIAHSTIPQRVKRCKTIFDSFSNNIQISSIIDNLTIFTSCLLEISNRKDNDHFNLSEKVASLRSLIDSHRLSNIIVPILDTLTCCVPSSPNVQNHSLFVQPLLFINNISERIIVLSSLIRPKKIEIIASDGNKYNLLCKPKDDLRRDSRLMEFNSLVNKLLLKNAKARKRNLKIHLYAVIVLNDECGIIEWVDDTVSYRSILLKLYNEQGNTLSMHEIKNIYISTQKNPDELLKVFTQKILPKFPPVFDRYFDQEFSDAAAWYEARQTYMQSAAVMSMVGYMLGLGDRHGDNILFARNGEVIHVDFNCLFNKGDHFEWPEKVPFRLTHNMQIAMGLLGIESCFRACCEITLDVMRARVDSLLCVLSTFLHDPLVEWIKVLVE